MLLDVIRRHRRLVLLGVPLLLVALVAGVLLARGSSDPPVVAVPQAAAGPVLLVPGYGGGTGALDQLALRLRAAGRDAAVVPLPGDGTGDLREQAAALDAAVRARIAAGAPSVDVVGFSAGGVVARVWAAELGGAQVARRVVTLGSPHHGTALAGLAAVLVPDSCPLACRQLDPDGDLLGDLDETPDGPVWTSVWTQQDDVVDPPDSAVLDGAVNVRVQDVCADSVVAHGALPADPLVVGIVLRALSGEPLAASPGAAECTTLRALAGP